MKLDIVEITGFVGSANFGIKLCVWRDEESEKSSVLIETPSSYWKIICGQIYKQHEVQGITKDYFLAFAYLE